jgi:hypothetical protein
MGKNVIISTLPNISQNYLPKVNTSNIFANSLVYDNGTNVMVNTTTANTDYTGARLVVSNTSNSYLEVRSTAGQSAIVLTTATSTTSNFPTVEIFNSADFGIVAYRPGVVSSNYLMYYELSSSTNRRLTFQTEGVTRLGIQGAGRILMGPTLPTDDGSTALQVNGGGKFSSSVTATDISLTSSNYDILKWQKTSGTASNIFSLSADSGGAYIQDVTNSKTLLYLAENTGAATFLSSVSTNGAINITVPYSAITMTFLTQDNLGNGIYLAPRSNLNFDYGVAGNTIGFINTFGYQNGSAHFRSLQIGNGKGGSIAFFDGTNGNVGIGTTSPSTTLHVAASTAPYIRIDDIGFGSENGITWQPSGYTSRGSLTLNYLTAEMRLSVGVSAATYFQTFYTNGAERMRITSGGNVGINTTDPRGRLESKTANIASGDAAYAKKAFVANLPFTTANVIASGLAFYDSSIYGADIGYSYDGFGYYMAFATNDNTTGDPIERMRISSGGNVGIGTTSPTDSIIGSGTFLDIASTGGGALKLHYTNATAYGEFSFYKGSNGSYIDSSGAATLANNDLIFRTGGTASNYGVSERMRITSGGNVSVNTTQQLGQLNVKRSASGSTARTLALYNNVEASVNTGVSIEFYPNNGDDDRCARISSVQSISGLYADLRFFTSNNALPVERMKISESGTTFIYSVYSQTSASAANVIVGSDGNLFRSTSSLKYKKDVVNYTKGLAEVMKLRPVTYKGKNEIDGNRQFAGLIAEEIHDLGLTEFVQYADDGTPDALAYQNMVALLTKAIQEQQAQIEELKSKLN